MANVEFLIISCALDLISDVLKYGTKTHKRELFKILDEGMKELGRAR